MFLFKIDYKTVKDRCRFSFRSLKEALTVIGSLFIIGSVWDSFSIFRGYWVFNKDFFLGINVGLMPMEEYLFMLVIPFMTLVVYRIAKR
jgi:lycopene cyclase domain-containing protein